MPWDPDQYRKFSSERSAPFDDLMRLVEPRPDLCVVDLGCGTGELTRRLADALPGSDVLGLDTSPAMLAESARFAKSGLRFEFGDQAALQGRWDLIFSNAALHWSDDHPQLLDHLFRCLRHDGQLAVQVPSNHAHISQRLIAETAREEPYCTWLKGFVRTSPVLPIDDYAHDLFELGASQIVVLEKIYPHVLENSDAVVEWISGTALIPYFERLGEHKDAFVSAIRHKMREAFPQSPVFFPFRRTLFSARKSA